VSVKTSKTAKRTKKEEAQARAEAEHEAFYQANKERIDEVLGYCIKHFKDDEHDIVRAVGRRLFDYYRWNRMKIGGGSMVKT